MNFWTAVPCSTACRKKARVLANALADDYLSAEVEQNCRSCELSCLAEGRLRKQTGAGYYVNVVAVSAIVVEVGQNQ